MKTPVTKKGLTKYDHHPPRYAAVLAWKDAGNNPRWHRRMQKKVRKAMPLLARALDRAERY